MKTLEDNVRGELTLCANIFPEMSEWTVTPWRPCASRS
jgi:hypothetical protein